MVSNPFSVAAIGTHVASERIDNAPRAERFEYDSVSLRTKIGVRSTARMEAGQETSDLCVLAYRDLADKIGDRLAPETLDLVVVVTQHPDGHGLPHTAAIVHGKLDLPKSCFAFDISLGCSGFVAALATVSGYLMATGGKRAIIFTADPYSKSISEDDRNTSMIFGDAATATLIEEGETWRIGRFDSGTKASRALERDAEGVLRMNGRAVFDFCAMNVPGSVKRTLELNGLSLEEVDAFALHPGSKFIVDTVAKRIGIPAPDELPCADFGNTVSSSIPLILADINPQQSGTILVSGFGVGLGWSTCVLTSEKK